VARLSKQKLGVVEKDLPGDQKDLVGSLPVPYNPKDRE